jgi:hypothetical protein
MEKNSMRRFLESRELRPHLVVLLAALLVNLAVCAVQLTRSPTYLDVLQLVSTVVLLVHWIWGASFYYYYYHMPKGARYYVLDGVIVVFLSLSVILRTVLALWFLFMLVNYAIAVFMYRVPPSSPHFDNRVWHFSRDKSRMDLVVVLLFCVGMVLDVVNRFLLHTNFVTPFCLIAMFVMTIAIHVWIFAARFYDLRKYVDRPLVHQRGPV